jgi:hypothetical protein
MTYSSREALSSLWDAAGLTDVEVSGVESLYESEFEHFWRYQYLQGQGGPAAYVVALPEDRREALKQRFRQEVLGNCATEAFTIKARVWAAKGTVP